MHVILKVAMSLLCAKYNKIKNYFQALMPRKTIGIISFRKISVKKLRTAVILKEIVRKCTSTPLKQS